MSDRCEADSAAWFNRRGRLGSASMIRVPAAQAPIFGVARALEHAKEKCFVLAVDYPLITTEILRFLAKRFTESSAPLLAPRWSGKLQMLCGGYAPALLPIIDERIAAGR